MGEAGGAAAAGVGIIGGAIAGQNAAGAIGQMGAANLEQQRADRIQAMGIAQTTPQEMQALQQHMAVNNQQIEQSQKLINSADPALMEAGNQALALMQGKSAASLAPLANQRAQQRAQLQQQLQQQLGPGYRTSSAGIQALNNFDQQSANLSTNVQQDTLQKYLGVSQNAAQLGFGAQQNSIGNIGSNVKMQQDQQQMQINALLGTGINPGQQYAGQVASAQAMGNTFGQVAGIGASGASKFLGAPPPVAKYAGGFVPEYAHGGVVPGHAPFPGQDHPANDIAYDKLSPGELVIPLSEMHSIKTAQAYVHKKFKEHKANKNPKGGRGNRGQAFWQAGVKEEPSMLEKFGDFIDQKTGNAKPRAISGPYSYPTPNKSKPSGYDPEKSEADNRRQQGN